MAARSMWPSAYLHGVGTPIRCSFSRLNTRPACSPVNASPSQLPAPTHDSGPLWVATPSTFRTCIYCTAPISPAHGEGEKERTKKGLSSLSLFLLFDLR